MSLFLLNYNFEVQISFVLNAFVDLGFEVSFLLMFGGRGNHGKGREDGVGISHTLGKRIKWHLQFTLPSVVFDSWNFGLAVAFFLPCPAITEGKGAKLAPYWVL